MIIKSSFSTKTINVSQNPTHLAVTLSGRLEHVINKEMHQILCQYLESMDLAPPAKLGAIKYIGNCVQHIHFICHNQKPPKNNNKNE